MGAGRQMGVAAEPMRIILKSAERAVGVAKGDGAD